MTCQDCGTEFHARADAKFCSVSCRQRAQRQRRERRDHEIESLRRKLEAAASPAAAVVDWDSLPPKVKDVIRRQVRREMEKELDQHRAKLDADFAAHKAAYDAQNQRINAMRDEERRRYQQGIDVHRAKGLITLDEYNTIRSCLHPDSRTSVTDKKLAAAFRLFNESRIKTLLVKSTPASKPRS